MKSKNVVWKNTNKEFEKDRQLEFLLDAAMDLGVVNHSKHSEKYCAVNYEENTVIIYDVVMQHQKHKMQL